MRITLDERKSMKRRLKNRISPAINAGLKQAPKFALIVAATFTVTPEAYAQIQNNEAEAHLTMTVNQDGGATTYTKEELAETMPANPSTTLNTRIYTEINALLNQIGKNQSSSQSKKARGKVMSGKVSMESEMEHLSAWKEAPNASKADGGKISQFLNGETKRAGSDLAKTRVGFLNTIKSGFKFDFDLGKIFGGSKKEEAPAKGKVRYGLVLKDIKPGAAPDRASTGSDYDEMAYAGHADVEWTIGPISETEGRKLFNFSAPKERHASKKNGGKRSSDTASSESYSISDSFASFDTADLPSGNFKASAKPDDVGDLTEKESLDVFPNVKWQLAQEEDLYTLEYRTKSDGTKIDAHHTFKIPIAGTMKLGRRFDDNWHVVSTSAYDILIDKRAPLVSIHYLHMDQRINGSASHKIDENQSVNLAVTGKASGIENDKDGKKSAENYKAGYTLKF